MMVDRMSNNYRHAANGSSDSTGIHQKVVVLSTPTPTTTMKAQRPSSPGRKKGRVRLEASNETRIGEGNNSDGEVNRGGATLEKHSSGGVGAPSKERVQRSAATPSSGAGNPGDNKSKRRESDSNAPLSSANRGRESTLEAPKSPRNHGNRPRRKSSPGPSHRQAAKQDDADRQRHSLQTRRSGKETSNVGNSDQEDEINAPKSHAPSKALRKSASNVASSNPPTPASPKGRSRQQQHAKESKSPLAPRSPGNPNRKSSRNGGTYSASPSRPRRTRSQRHNSSDGEDDTEHDALPKEQLSKRGGSAPPPPPPLSPIPAQQQKVNRKIQEDARPISEGRAVAPCAAALVTPRPPSPPMLTTKLATVPATKMLASSNADMVDIVALEPPDYDEFYSSPRRRKSTGAGAGAVPTSHDNGRNSASAQGPDQPALLSRAEAAGTAERATTGAPTQSQLPAHKSNSGATTTAQVPNKSKVTAATATIQYYHAAALTPVVEPATPKAANKAETRAARVASTRSRLQGVMGSLQWVIHIDTPGGHAHCRLQLVPAVEVWDDYEGDNYAEENGTVQETPHVNQNPTQGTAAIAPSCAMEWSENSLHLTGDDKYDDDDSSLDTQKLHESVLHFVKKLETARPGATAQEGFDDSIIDYAHSSHQQRPESQARDIPQPESQTPSKESLHSQQPKPTQSVHSSTHRGAASDRRPSQPQRHVSHASMWSSNRLVQPQVQAPPPPPPKPTSQSKAESSGSLPSDSVTTSSSSRLLSQFEQQQQQQHDGPVQAHQLVLTPSDHFVPRVMNIQGMVLLNDTAYRVERENSKDSRTFADTLGDDTIENSCDMPDMWQIDEFEKSQTWGHSNDFSASDAGDDGDDEETLDNPFPGGKSVDTNVLEDYDEDDDDDDVSEYQKNRAAGYLTNYGYAGTPGSAVMMKGSVDRGSNAQSADEGSIDPSKGFLPRGSKASTLTDATDSLADIQDSFACDSGVEDFQHSQLTEKRRNQMGAGTAPDSANHASNNQSSYSQSLSSLPEDRVLDDGHVASGHGAYTGIAPGGVRRTIGILGGGALPSMKRSPESHHQSQSLLGGRREAAARISATQHQSTQRPLAMRQRVHAAAKQYSSPSTSSNSDSSVPKLASQFADSFLGPANCPSSALKNGGLTTCSENDAHALQSGKLAMQRSLTSLSTGSDSSTSMQSFGIPGLRASNQGDAKAFVQFNIASADGVKVVHNEDEVHSGRGTRSLPNRQMTTAARSRPFGARMNDRSEHDQSIDEFNANAMPPLEDMEAPPVPDVAPARRLPGRGISLLGSRRAGAKKIDSATAEPAAPVKTPKASNRRFLRREKSSAAAPSREDSGLPSRSSHHDIVKRFFTLANASFGSLGPPSEFLDDDETNNDDDFRY